jgi:membrane carboxypeptidase/penicillin-binding protein PbpC
VESCDWHRVTPRGVIVRWPAAYQEWAASQRLSNVTVVAPLRRTSPRPPVPQSTRESVARAFESEAAVRVLSPPNGAVYLLDPTLRREFQTIGLRAATEDAAPIEWRVDDALIGTTAPDAPLNWPLTPGPHVITARDPHGRNASASIVVK